MQCKCLGDVKSLKSEKEIQTVFEKGKKRCSPKFNLYYLRNDNKAVLKLSIFISKKKVKRAVDRNRIRRIIKEFFRTEARKLKGYSIICILRVPVKGSINFVNITRELKPLVQRVFSRE